MGDLKRFLKQNKKKKENIFVPATTSILGEDGKPELWEIRALTTTEDNAIREECTIDVPVTGKPGMFRPKLNAAKYVLRIAAKCIVYPNLNDKELQDSYGAMSAEDLIEQILDDPGEFNTLMNKIQELNGYNETFQEKVEKAKN